VSWLLLILALPVIAADLVLTGRLERVRQGFITIRLPDGRVVDAFKPDGIAVSYNVADQVEIDCAPVKTVYDAQAKLHYHWQLKSLRFVRAATPLERAEAIARLSWQPEENLLKVPAAAPPADPSGLDRVRRVNLEYRLKLPSFVADEIVQYHHSDDVGKPWRLTHTIEAEVAIKNGRPAHQNIRRDGKPWKPRLEGQLNSDFGIHLTTIFDDARCPTRIEFAGREVARGMPMLVYHFSSPPDGCFGGVVLNGKLHVPAVTGRVLVDPAKGNAVMCEWEGSGFPEKFGADRYSITESWDYVTIAGASYLIPAWRETVVLKSGGEMERLTTEYKNFRHFESSTSVTFDKEN
jgi:hypothetical protein